MKKLLFIAAILATTSCLGQTSTKGDTLVITYKKAIKFIKFGDKIYEVVQPSLKEVEPGLQFRAWNGEGNHGIRFFDNMMPSQKLLLKNN